MKHLVRCLLLLSLILALFTLAACHTEQAPDTTVSLLFPEDPPTSDPYVNIDKADFYASYQPAASLADALYRSEHKLMSGSIEAQDQKPTLAADQPMKNGLLIRNTDTLYRDNGNSYAIVDENGTVVKWIFKGGAYVTLEEVAAYVLAFGDIPANYTPKKSVKSYDALWEWGEYLRLNHTKFTGNTQKYPYEPALPRITGIGGDLTFYEMDIGTTGTDCDPAYRPYVYNNGSTITRGAARIVYTRFDANRNSIIDPNEKYVFYTYNHYNDFQEYLNYYGGWGKIFGNITGGGKISNKTDCHPTPYIETAREKFTSLSVTVITVALPFERADRYLIALIRE